MPRVWLEAPDTVSRGTRVKLRLILLNDSDSAVDLCLRGREPTMEVVVNDENGETVWRRLAGEMIPAVLQLRSLAPGEQLDVSADWDLRVDGTLVAPGAYLVRASLVAEDQVLEASPVRLDITSGDSNG
jgi:hypothetical protein